MTAIGSVSLTGHRRHPRAATAPPCGSTSTGRQVTEEADGNGPVDAVFNAIKAHGPHEAVLELYQVHAVTEGTDAQAEVSVRLAADGRSVTARGADPDTLVASAKAYLGALNKLLAGRVDACPARGRVGHVAPYCGRPQPCMPGEAGCGRAALRLVRHWVDIAGRLC
jgi:hypothetical protein